MSSILSVLSPSKSSPNGQPLLFSPPPLRRELSHNAKTPSVALTDEIDPDELFTKYTVGEVRFIQNRLRADADAKQEELRIMVGERYRDLLQASSSIIAISQSAKRVVQALDDSKHAILAQEEPPPLPKQPMPQGSSDSHLRALQLLSAHIKLLLDAPEHLWRLIEKKKYFTAAWLFRLSLVVHRSLVGDDGRDWNTQGLDVLEQFPLIQRQLDSINQFRQPIVHKAVQSLREYSTSPEEVCAALLPLSLLNSQPLGETFEVFLEQRTKTLNAMLIGKQTAAASSPLTRQGNGHVVKKAPAAKSIPDIRDTTLAAMDAITRTVDVSRILFQNTDSRPSLMSTILDYIQSDSIEIPANGSLPQELQLTTHNILMTLPSSTNFLLLPQSVRSYKPSAPQKSSTPQSFYVSKLKQWFSQATQTLQLAAQKLFLDLRTVKDVWNLRLSIQKWTRSASGLEDTESVTLNSMFNQVYRERVLAIWQAALTDAYTSFENTLDSAVTSISKNDDEHRLDISPVDFLFEAPPLPMASQTGSVGLDSSFHRYKSALRKQLLGRTSLLDDVLKTLETCAKIIQQDFSQILKGEDGDTRLLVAGLSESYQPYAESLCTGVIKKLTATAQSGGDPDLPIRSLVFIGRVAYELASSSSFVTMIGCNKTTALDFRTKSRELHDSIVDRWRTHTVSGLVDQHILALRTASRSTASVPTAASEPSPQLIQSLISLSKAVQDLGIFRDVSRYYHVAETTLRHFITELAGHSWDVDELQALQDLLLLRRLADLQSWSDVCALLDERIKATESKRTSSAAISSIERAIADYLARTQTLFAALLPRPPAQSQPAAGGGNYATLLYHGLPSNNQPLQSSALQLAQNPLRFSTLLVN